MEYIWARDPIPVEVTHIPSETWTGASIAALAVSIAAALIAVVTAFINYQTWKKSGPILKVRADIVWVEDGSFGVGIVVENSGRLATVVSAISFPVRGGYTLATFPQYWLVTPIPSAVEPGAACHFIAPISLLADACRERSIAPHNLRATVVTGHGEVTVDLEDKLTHKLQELLNVSGSPSEGF